MGLFTSRKRAMVGADRALPGRTEPKEITAADLLAAGGWPTHDTDAHRLLHDTDLPMVALLGSSFTGSVNQPGTHCANSPLALPLRWTRDRHRP